MQEYLWAKDLKPYNIFYHYMKHRVLVNFNDMNSFKSLKNAVIKSLVHDCLLFSEGYILDSA